MSKIAFVTIAHKDYADESCLRWSKAASDMLAKSGVPVEVIDVPVTNYLIARETGQNVCAKGFDGVVLFLGSWMECPNAMGVLREVEHLPVCLWGFPMFENEGALTGTGSFVAYMMFKGTMDRLGYKYIGALGMPDDPDVIAQVKSFCIAAGAMQAMKRFRIGHFGYASMGIYTGTFDHVLMRGRIGPEVVHYDSYTLINRAEALSVADCSGMLDRLRQYRIREDVGEEDLLKAARFTKALLDLCGENGLDAVNIKCQYEFSKEYGFVMCVPLSLLAEYGVISSCEGDILCTASMSILGKLSGSKTTYGDCLTSSGDVLKLSACGFIPFSMGIPGEQEIRRFLPHPGFSGIQCGFVQRPGQVTVMRLIEDIGEYHILYFTGQGLETELRQGYMPALDVRLADGCSEFLKQANGQHYAICYGDISNEIEAYATLMGIKAIKV